MSKRKKPHNREEAYKAVRSSLMTLYDTMPETKGCMEHIDNNCHAWCCACQSPQALSVEFMHTWWTILRKWEVKDMIALVKRALETYVLNAPTKGCVFWNPITYMCNQHETRCYNCRIYGIIPDEEFRPHFNKMREYLADKPEAVLRYQCPLVSTEDGREVTTDDTEYWWDELVEIEKAFGIDSKDIHDRFGGSYRTYHDHILLHLYTDETLQNLTTIRLKGSEEEKATAVEAMVRHFLDRVMAAVSPGPEEIDE